MVTERVDKEPLQPITVGVSAKEKALVEVYKAQLQKRFGAGVDVSDRTVVVKALLQLDERLNNGETYPTSISPEAARLLSSEDGRIILEVADSTLSMRLPSAEKALLEGVEEKLRGIYGAGVPISPRNAVVRALSQFEVARVPIPRFS